MEMIQTRVMRHLKVLSSEIGVRPIGAISNHEASSYIENIFKSSGINIETQQFEIPCWENIEASLTIYGHLRKVTSNIFSPSVDVTAEVVPLCTIDELASSQLDGKIAVLYGELAKENFTAKGFTIYNPEHHKQIIHLLEQKNPAAVITVNLHTHTDLPLISDWDFGIPSVTISPEDALLLIGTNAPPSVHLKIHSKRTLGHTKNVIGRKEGSRNEKIIMSAHYDSVFGSPGAFDNASGVAVLLTLVEELSQRGFKTGFEFVAFGSEEYLGIGDRVYINKHKDELRAAIAALNFDGVGQILGTNTVTLMAGSSQLEDELRRIKSSFPSVHWTNPWYDSNHFTFFSNGVPSIPIRSTGVTDLIHTKNDEWHWISPSKLAEVVTLAIQMIEMLQDKRVDWSREAKS
ncbi:M28 family peptidase [Paenibacillus sediminis]|uniref:Carboxypeptidase Q n=2 Tax=Paenibacillus sediminis TaxID=664909 RepID=A0ABS4H3S2_9BACL|nr:Iap family predicted aminopeptidase [Paenibacillus sediminis]